MCFGIGVPAAFSKCKGIGSLGLSAAFLKAQGLQPHLRFSLSCSSTRAMLWLPRARS